MFARLVQKELLSYLLDFRFIALFAICALLSALSVYVGTRNYVTRLQEYNAVSESNRRTAQEWLQSNLTEFEWMGYGWNRRPEVLSPVVHGLSGVLGKEVTIKYDNPPQFVASLFETDPIYALFGVLDLAFIVKVVLSLTVLLFTYDAICGEKEGGTLRLYASFPVPRSHLALAKLVGATVAVLTPFLFAYLLAAAVLSLSSGAELLGEDWGRMAALMGMFVLYLAVFAAFGLWGSALTHRRMTAFLGLLGLWTVWLFVVPNLAVRAARGLTPVESTYDLERQAGALRWENRKERQAEIKTYWQRNRVENWNALPEVRRREIMEGARKTQERLDMAFYSRLKDLQTKRRNDMRQEQRLAMALSATSPMSAVTFVSMDLARTGYIQQEQIEDALSAHLIYMSRVIRGQEDPAHFSWFTYQDRETVGECLSRNAIHILNLTLLAIAGFAGAYVAILRYDVR